MAANTRQLAQADGDRRVESTERANLAEGLEEIMQIMEAWDVE